MITVTRRLLFNLDRYESAEITVTVTDIPDDTDPDEISRQIDDVMAPELRRAELATSKTADDTSLYTWNQIATEGA
jgi:hypothetical protein